MSSKQKKILDNIDQLRIHGKYREAEKIIENELKMKDLSKEEELNLLVQKSEILFYLGDYQEAFRLSESILRDSSELDEIFLEIDALYMNAVRTYWADNIPEGLEILENALEKISKVTDFPIEVVAKRKAKLLCWKSFIIAHLGRFDEGIDLGKEALTYAEKSGYKDLISFCLIVIGDAYLRKGEANSGVEYVSKALKIAIDIKNKFYIGYCYGELAYNEEINLRNKEEALELFNKCFDLSNEIGSTLLLAFKNNAANILRDLHQLDKALEYYQEGFSYAPWGRYIKFTNMGYIYFLKNDFEQAMNYYLESNEACEEAQDTFYLPLNLYNLVSISLELKQHSKAKEYLNRLKELSEDPGTERIIRLYRFASILVLKATGDINDLAEATKLLIEFLYDEDLPSHKRLNALFSLLEIRIKELQLTTNEDNLKEVQKRIHHLEVEAEEQKYQWLLADTYRLHSQLALIELDVKGAIEFLDKAQQIAEEINIELLMEKVKADQKNIEQQQTMWNNLQKQKAPVSETVKLVSLESTVKNIKEETVLEEKDKETGEIIEYRKLFALKI